MRIIVIIRTFYFEKKKCEMMKWWNLLRTFSRIWKVRIDEMMKWKSANYYTSKWWNDEMMKWKVRNDEMKSAKWWNKKCEMMNWWNDEMMNYSDNNSHFYSIMKWWIIELTLNNIWTPLMWNSRLRPPLIWINSNSGHQTTT